MITGVAVPYQAYELTHSSLVVGLLGLVGVVPLLTVPLVGGAIADALDRRRVLLVTGLGLMLVSAGLVVNAVLPEPRVWALFVLEGLLVAIYSFGTPAMRSLTAGTVLICLALPALLRYDAAGAEG